MAHFQVLPPLQINFTAYASGAFTEALLMAHQEEIEKNEQLLSTLGTCPSLAPALIVYARLTSSHGFVSATDLDPILRLIHDRERILKEKTSFERETSDPKRLLSKVRLTVLLPATRDGFNPHGRRTLRCAGARPRQAPT